MCMSCTLFNTQENARADIFLLILRVQTGIEATESPSDEHTEWLIARRVGGWSKRYRLMISTNGGWFSAAALFCHFTTCLAGLKQLAFCVCSCTVVQWRIRAGRRTGDLSGTNSSLESKVRSGTVLTARRQFPSL